MYPRTVFSSPDSSVYADFPQHIVKWLSSRPGPIVTHSAMLRQDKEHALIIEALPQVLAVYGNLRYVIAGEGGKKARLERMVRQLYLDEHVYFADMVSPITPFLKISTLAVPPSLVEPLGMFQAESQYLGIPTLENNVCGIVETIQHQKTGLLIEVAKDGACSSNII